MPMPPMKKVFDSGTSPANDKFEQWLNDEFLNGDDIEERFSHMSPDEVYDVMRDAFEGGQKAGR